MDWSLKAPAWDLTEFDQAAISNIHAVQGSSSLGDNKIRGDFSIDLKLGRVGSCNLTENLMDKAKGAQLGSGSSKNKRARAAGNGTQIVSCLVDGCISDLSNCREYHRRHKVCEQHSKTPLVTIRGHKQRFCQQCSRFHSLEEFDEGKRSCRKRLDGHNKRRRKPQPEAISRGSFLSNYQGSQMSFSNTQVYPSTTVSVMNGNTAWSGADEDARLYKQHQQVNKQSSFLGTSSGSSSSRYYYKEGGGGGGDKQLQGHSLTLNDLSICQPPRNIFCDTDNAVPYEDCALSLLSSPQLQTSGLSLDSSGRDAHIHYPPNFQLPSQTLAFRWDH